MRYWSLLFALIAVLAVAIFVIAPFAPEWWLPNPSFRSGPIARFSLEWWLPNPNFGPGRSVSTIGREIDLLFVMILVITGAVFIGTQVALVWATYRYADRLDAEGRPVRKAHYSHGSQKLEIIWTIIPAAVLVFITIYQMGTWANIKYKSAAPKVAPVAEITARQFQWVIRYPGPDSKLNTVDDLFAVNDFHFVKDKPTLIHLKSSDVLHSFYLPEMRIKQDAVPGMTIPVWFDADTAGEYELVCAELCGWGHYKMRGKVVVHETDAEFQKWQDEGLAEQSRSQLSMAGDKAEEVNR